MAGQTSLNNTGRVLDAGPGPYAGRLKTITASLTMDQSHDDVLIVANAAAGLAITLPTATGSGAKYKILIGTTITSNTTTIKVNNTTDAFVGFSEAVSDDPATVKGFIASPASDDTITFNGTTQGGYVGDYVEIIDYAAGAFFVRVVGKQTGTEATPFSATV